MSHNEFIEAIDAIKDNMRILLQRESDPNDGPYEGLWPMAAEALRRARAEMDAAVTDFGLE